MRFIALIICLIFINPLFANVNNYQTDSFANIATLYEQLHLNPKKTLMVFDLDDTLITMTQPLGSVGWWDWQYNLQKNESQSDKLFTKEYLQLVRIQNILFQLVKMEVTDEYVIPFIQKAAEQEAILIGLTARGKEHLSATLMQLKDNKFTIDDKLFFKKRGLKYNDKTSVAGKFKCPQFSREVIYQQGIMFLDGEDKGQALRCLLARAKREVKTIFFVDDAKRNITSVEKAFSNQNEFEVWNIFYTKELPKQREIQLNSTLQAELFQQWSFLKTNLNKVITQSNI